MVLHEACGGLPCAVVAVDVASGDQVTLAHDGWQAAVGLGADGRARVVLETGPDGRGLRSMGLDGRDVRDLTTDLDGRRLVAGPARTGGAVELGPDRIVLGPGGRVPLDGPSGVVVRRIGEGRASTLEEALPMTPIRRHRTTSRRATWALVALVALVAVSLLPVTAVNAHGPDPVMSDNLYGQDQVLEFRWRSGAEPPTAIKTAIKDAAADITASRGIACGHVRLRRGWQQSHRLRAGCDLWRERHRLLHAIAPNTFTMWLREHGRVFDWGTLKWCQMYSSAPNGCYDVETIALDEFGHIEVLAHHVNYSDDRDYLDAVVQTYSRTKPRTGWDEHTLGRCDVATLQREYDVPNSSTKISTCLDLDTTASISASTTATIYGGVVKFSAVLKVAAVDGYGRLKSNALSGRSVKLQRRAPGTTTWATVATMTAGSTAGTYTASATITADGEFRSLFSAPTNEGLNGDREFRRHDRRSRPARARRAVRPKP